MFPGGVPKIFHVVTSVNRIEEEKEKEEEEEREESQTGSGKKGRKDE